MPEREGMSWAGWELHEEASSVTLQSFYNQHYCCWAAIFFYFFFLIFSPDNIILGNKA